MKAATLLIIFLFSAWFALPATAQKLRMGFLAGPNFTLANYDFPADEKIIDADDPGDFTRSWTTNAAPGLFAGFDVQYDLQEKIFASGALIVNLHNYNAKQQNTYTSGKYYEEYEYQYSIVDLQIPLLLNYRMGKISAGVGAFVAASLGGNFTFTRLVRSGGENRSTFSQALVFNNDEFDYADFRPFNAGLRAELGYGIKRWRLAAHIDLGLPNLAPRADSGDVAIHKYPTRRSNLGISCLFQPWPR
jgi:hypothetical protein